MSSGEGTREKIKKGSFGGQITQTLEVLAVLHNHLSHFLCDES